MKIKKYILLLLFISGIFFCFAFFINPQLNKSLRYRNLKNEIIHKFINIFGYGYQECIDIPEINNIPYKSSIVIGHAYGSPYKESSRNNSAFLSKKVIKFIDKLDPNKVDKLIFSGDLFSHPTAEKWIELNSRYGKLFSIHISPGNHDIRGRTRENNKYRDIFNKYTNQQINFPYSFSASGFTIIIDDSNVKNSIYDEKLLNIVKNNYTADSRILLIRHHVPIKDLANYKNSKSEIPSFDEFSNLYRGLKMTIISGDYVGHLNSLACKSNNEIDLIINGIREDKTDRIIVLSNAKLFQIKI